MKNINKKVKEIEERLEGIEQVITYYKHTYQKDAFLHATRKLHADRNILVRTLARIEAILNEYEEFANMSYLYDDPEHKVQKIWRLVKVKLILDSVKEEEE